MVKKVFYCIFIIAALMAAMSFTPPPKYGKLTISFWNFVGDKHLKLDSIEYKNFLGQSFTVTMFKYYVGNFHLRNMKGEEFISHRYFLIDQDDNNSMRIIIDSIPVGEYNSIGFTLGVDSINNCSGAQAGALDPVNGMYWSWNSGYIFLKMEGISPVSNSNGKRLEFHIGGYKKPNDCMKDIGFEKTIKISDKQDAAMIIGADLSHLFSVPNPIDFSKISSVTDFHNAKVIAENYNSMFKVITIGNISPE